jgi:hypothetical protein
MWDYCYWSDSRIKQRNLLKKSCKLHVIGGNIFSSTEKLVPNKDLYIPLHRNDIFQKRQKFNVAALRILGATPRLQSEWFPINLSVEMYVFKVCKNINK